MPNFILNAMKKQHANKRKRSRGKSSLAADWDTKPIIAKPHYSVPPPDASAPGVQARAPTYLLSKTQ
jgi:hypothetical protein